MTRKSLAAIGLVALVTAASITFYSSYHSEPKTSTRSATSTALSLQSSTSSSASQSANESGSQTVSVQSTNASSTALSSSSTALGINESSRGLELSVSTNSTLQEAEKLTIVTSLLDSSPSPLIVPASDDWQVHGFPVAFWSSCSGVEPLEFMVVKGNYTLGDLQSASANASVPEGGCMEAGQVYNLVFLGEGSEANATGQFCEASCFPNNNRVNLEANFTVDGYWAYPINSSEAEDIFTPPTPECTASGIPDCITYQFPEAGPFAQHGFIPGLYTLAVADEWGQTDIIHFTVGTATTTETSSSSGAQPPLGCSFAGTIDFGVAEDIYMSPAPTLGSTVCVYVHVDNNPPQFPSPITFTITNSTDHIFFIGQCADIQGEPGSCSTSWDTAQSYKGVLPAGGSYRLLISFGGQDLDTGISFTVSA